MATYLELQWLSLDATPSTDTNSDPATGTLQNQQLTVLNELFAVALADGSGSAPLYAVSTVLSTRYRALADGTGYTIDDILQRDRLYLYDQQVFAVTWVNVTQSSSEIEAPAAADVLATTVELITNHVDQRELVLPDADPTTQSITYVVDPTIPGLTAIDTGWQ